MAINLDQILLHKLILIYESCRMIYYCTLYW